MKRIFLIFALLINLVAVSQNQTFTGVKTFANPPKFKNVLQNNANTKVLTVNSNDVLQWRDANTIAPTLQAVTNVGNTTTKPIIINDNYLMVKHLNDTPERTVVEPGCLKLMTTETDNQAILRADNVTDYKTFQFPNTEGTLVVDAPADGQNYVRNNNTWQVSSSGSTPSLQQVLNAGNISTNKYIYLTNDGDVGAPSTVSSLMLNYDGTLTLRALNNASAYITTSLEHINTQYATYISPDGGAVAKISNAANYNFAPPSNSANGYKGEIRVVGGYLYVCTTSNPTTGVGTWVRSAVQTTW